MPNVIQLPRLPVAPEHVPEPQHSLLVHDRDMTSTLAAHHEHEILLDVLEMMHGPSSVTRTVLLMAGDKPVFLSQRFDRNDDGRIPFISAMKLKTAA